MLANKGKISIRQALLLYVTITYTPAIRWIASHTAEKAKQAAWLCPIATFFVILLLMYIYKKIYMNYPDNSLMEVYYDIASKPIGKIIVAIYAIWLIILLSFYIRQYAERLVHSNFAHVNINIFIIVMLIVVAIIIKSGIVVVARMNEIIVAIVSLVIVFLVTLMLPNISINNLTPISRLDILPILEGSMGTTEIVIYITYVLFFSHEIIGKDKFVKTGFYIAILLFVIYTAIITSTVGVLGYSIAERMPLPFMGAIRQISLLDVLTGFESILIASWVTADFILIIVYTYSILHILKSLFNLSEYKPLINIVLVLIYILTLYIAYDAFELSAFASNTPIMNYALGIVIPLLMFVLGKIRRKI